ncbi:MAG TPA: metal-dependent hydrolase [Pyrinomonadaceae bacterium]|nr:metal-dependent hydrolase [Pyrinomonadaceae bacterium]
MASVFTHAFFAAAMGGAYVRGRVPARFWVLAMLCAVLPDADVLAFGFGIPYGSMFGHRGFTHSLAFAALSGVLVTAVFFRDSPRKASLALFFALATASHAALDALTDGGLGVALFAPFSGRRYFFPFRPVEVSPIGVGAFFSEWGLAVIKSELLWVWFPAGLCLAAVIVARRVTRSPTRERE